MTVLASLAIVFGLVVLNGLFVAAEFAIVGAPRASIEHQAAMGGRLAVRVRRVLDDTTLQDRYIATTQVGISVASLGLGMYGEHVIADLVGDWLSPWPGVRWMTAHAIASVVALACLTYMHIVIGEMVPKALAMQKPDTAVLYVTPVIQAVQVAIRPLVVALNTVGNALLRLLGVHRQEGGAERYHTSDELQFIIKESQEGGLLRGESGRILRELFEFGDLTAGAVMTPRVSVSGVRDGAGPDELRHVVRTHPYTRYPIHRGDLDHIVGSLHIKDLLRHLVSNEPLGARDARPLPYVPFTAPLDEVLAAMRRARAQMAVVMDEHGGTAGLITIEDLFDEVVGEIEEGRDRSPIERDSDGRLRVRGTVSLKDVGDALGVTLEHPAVSSVSGLVLTLLGRPPVPGEAVTWNRVRVEVAAVSGRGVGDAIVSVVPTTSSAQPGAP